MSGVAHADFNFSITGTGIGIDNANLAASANFTFKDSTDTLTVTLTNTATEAIRAQGNALTGVFWQFVPQPTLTRVSAALKSGSKVTLNNVVQNASTYNLNSEWAYADGITGYPESAMNNGISASGLGLFSSNDTFSGSGMIGGADYGLISSLGVTGEDGTPTRNFVNNSMVFTFSTSAHLLQTDFKTFAFQYGSALSEPFIPAPEPASTAGIVAGLLVMLKRRKRKA